MMNFIPTFLRRIAHARQVSPLLERFPTLHDRIYQHEISVFSLRYMSSNGEKDRDDKDDTSLIVSQFKNQIVHQLWTERAKAKREPSFKSPGGSSTCPSLDQAGKTPCQSETKIEYPFSTQELLAESYKSPWNC